MEWSKLKYNYALQINLILIKKKCIQNIIIIIIIIILIFILTRWAASVMKNPT